MYIINFNNLNNSDQICKRRLTKIRSKPSKDTSAHYKLSIKFIPTSLMTARQTDGRTPHLFRPPTLGLGPKHVKPPRMIENIII